MQIPAIQRMHHPSKDDAQAEDSQDDSQDQEDQSTDSLLQDFENQQADGTAYEQFFGFLN